MLVERAADVGVQFVPVELEHAVLVADLLLHHKDPFDRLIAAQCIIEDLNLISVDPVFNAYGVNRIW